MTADLRRAGVKKRDAAGQCASFHSFRKFFGTQLAKGGADPFIVKNLMRHASIDTTNRIYIDAKQLQLSDKASAALGIGTATAGTVKKDLTATTGTADDVPVPDGRDTPIGMGRHSPMTPAGFEPVGAHGPDDPISEIGENPSGTRRAALPVDRDRLRARAIALVIDWLEANGWG